MKEGRKEGKINKNKRRKSEYTYLFRDLSGDLVGTDGILSNLLPLSKVASKEDKRNRNTKPKGHEGQNGGEGSSSRFDTGLENIENDENDEDGTREGEGSHDGVLLPVGTLKHLVAASREVSCKDSASKRVR